LTSPSAQSESTAVDRWSFWLLAVGLWGTPFLLCEAWPAFSRGPKLIVLLTLGLGLGAVHLWDVWRSQTRNAFGLPPSAIACALLVLYVGLRAIFASNGYEANLRWLFVCAVIGVAFVTARLRWDERRVTTLAGGLAIVAMVTFVLAVAQFFEQPWAVAIPSTGQPSARLGYRNVMAMVSNALLAFGLVAMIPAGDARSRCMRGLALLAGLAAASTLILTRTRGAWLGSAVAAMAVGGSLLRRHLSRRRAGLVGSWSAKHVAIAFGSALAVLLVLGGVFMLEKPLPAVRQAQVADKRELTEKKASAIKTLTSIVKEGEDSGRMANNRATLAMFLDQPVLGVGPGQWVARYPFYWRDAQGVPNATVARFYHRQHNDWLQWLAEMGLVGFLLAAAAALPLAAWTWRNLGFAGGPAWAAPATLVAIYTTCALGVHAALDFPFEMPLPSMLQAVSLGLVAAAYRANVAAREPALERGWWGRWSSFSAWQPQRRVLLLLAVAGTAVAIQGAIFVGHFVPAQQAIASAAKAKGVGVEGHLRKAVAYEPDNHKIVNTLLIHMAALWAQACAISDSSGDPAAFINEDRLVSELVKLDDHYFSLVKNPGLLLASLKTWALIGDRAARRERASLQDGTPGPAFSSMDAYQLSLDRAEELLSMNALIFEARFVRAKTNFFLGRRAAGLEEYSATIDPERDGLDQWAGLARMAAATEGYAALAYHAMRHLQVASAELEDPSKYTGAAWFKAAFQAARQNSGIVFLDPFTAYRDTPRSRGWVSDPDARAEIVSDPRDLSLPQRRILHFSAPATTHVAMRRGLPSMPAGRYSLRVRGRAGAGATVLGLASAGAEDQEGEEWLASVPIADGDRAIEFTHATEGRLILVLGRSPGAEPGAIGAWVEEVEIRRLEP
jgi:O-antigen ligase